MIWSALIGVVAVALYAYQDGVNRCQDGDRYTSGVAQPTPFNRRFCSWPPRLLMVVTWTSFVILASLVGGWKSTLLFVSLPGVWFCVTHPTTVDGPAMLLSWLSSLAFQSGHPLAAVGLSVVGGFVHERSPVFAALYAWHPIPLLGVVAPALLGAIRRPAAPNHQSPELADRLVGHSPLGAISAHHDYVDMLSEAGSIWSLRGLPFMVAALGAGPAAWASLGVAYASRLIGTDTARFIMWAAPPLCFALKDAPLWMVAIHVATFRRVVQ